MKKLSIYLMLAIAGLLTVACGNEDNEFAPLKVAEPEEAIEIPEITASQLADVIDLNEVELSEELDLQVFTVSEGTMPEGVELTKGEIKFEDGTVIETTADGKVAGKDLQNYIASIYGQYPSVRSLTGTVYLYAVKNGAAVKVKAGDITIKAIPESYPEYIYAVGNVNGTTWGPAFPVYGPDYAGIYQGFYYIKGDFKFRSHEDSWEAPDWGWGDPEGTLAVGAGNLWAEDGFYVVNADLGAMTWSVKKIDFIDIVGGVVGGASDWSNGPHMTYNTEKQCWEADVELTGAFKFRGNGNWGNDDGNFGGTVDNIINGSNDNVNPTVTGPVHVELYLSCNGKSYASITAR